MNLNYAHAELSYLLFNSLYTTFSFENSLEKFPQAAHNSCSHIERSRPLSNCNNVIVAGFQKINHLVTFKTLNISKALHSKNQNCCGHRISLCHALSEILWNILFSECVLLWHQYKVLGSIYFICDKVVDFPKSDHNYNFSTEIPLSETKQHTYTYTNTILIHYIKNICNSVSTSYIPRPQL